MRKRWSVNILFDGICTDPQDEDLVHWYLSRGDGVASLWIERRNVKLSQNWQDRNDSMIESWRCIGCLWWGLVISHSIWCCLNLLLYDSLYVCFSTGKGSTNIYWLCGHSPRLDPILKQPTVHPCWASTWMSLPSTSAERKSEAPICG